MQALIVDHEIVSLITAIRYPDSHAHLGGSLVSEKFNGKGYYTQGLRSAMQHCDPKYTIGSDVAPSQMHTLQNKGFKSLWDTYVVKFSLQNIAKQLATITLPKGLNVKSLSDVQLEKLLEYDLSVFGTDRQVFIEKWISSPGSFGYAAVDGNDKIVGHVTLKQAVGGAGKELGLAIAPLYSEALKYKNLGCAFTTGLAGCKSLGIQFQNT